MKELEITIAGQAATGKSTMMWWLERILIEKGFTVEMNFELEKLDYGTEEKFRRAMLEHATERELALMKNTKITLKTVQTRLSDGS